MPYTDWHPFGADRVKVAIGNNSLVDLGIVNGEVNWRIRRLNEDAKDDYWGPALPADKQQLGMLGQLQFRLSRWDETVLRSINSTIPGTRVNGEMAIADIGTFLFASQKFLRFGFVPKTITGSTFTEEPWCFQCCLWEDAGGNLSNRFGEITLNIDCYPNNGGYLYRRQLV